MDARLIVFGIWAALEAGLIFGYMQGTLFGVRVAVKSYLKEEGAFDGPVPASWLDFYNDTRAELGALDTRDARAWCRKHKLPFNAETLALYNDTEYRRGVDGDNA